MSNFAQVLYNKVQRMLRKKRAYANVFKEDSIHTQVVLADLRAFCPTDPTLNGSIKNRDQVFVLIGRRQVLSRIQKQLSLSDEEINRIAKTETEVQANGGTTENW